MMFNDILYMAPIRGVTDYIFRSVFSKHFGEFDLAVAPFLKTVNGELKNNALKDLLPKQNKNLRVIPQLLSKNSNDFISAIKNLKELGYTEINWNLGCPHLVVTKKKKGAGLLKYPNEIENILHNVLSKTDAKISIKIRLGLNVNTQFFDLLPVLNQFPLSEIIVHPRNATQMYDGKIDLQELKRCIEISKHPIVFSGDIATKKNYVDLKAQFPMITKWMIGRGAIVNPFLPGNIKHDLSKNIADHKDIAAQFHSELYSRYVQKLEGPSHVIFKMREIWKYWAFAFDGSYKFEKKIKKVKTLSDYKQIVDDFLTASSL